MHIRRAPCAGIPSVVTVLSKVCGVPVPTGEHALKLLASLGPEAAGLKEILNEKKPEAAAGAAAGEQ